MNPMVLEFKSLADRDHCLKNGVSFSWENESWSKQPMTYMSPKGVALPQELLEELFPSKDKNLQFTRAQDYQRDEARKIQRQIAESTIVDEGVRLNVLEELGFFPDSSDSDEAPSPNVQMIRSLPMELKRM